MSQNTNGGQHVTEIAHAANSKPGPETIDIPAVDKRASASAPLAERKCRKLTVPEAGAMLSTGG